MAVLSLVLGMHDRGSISRMIGRMIGCMIGCEVVQHD